MLTVTTYNTGSLEFASEQVNYRFLPGAHTNGDLFVLFPSGADEPADDGGGHGLTEAGDGAQTQGRWEGTRQPRYHTPRLML